MSKEAYELLAKAVGALEVEDIEIDQASVTEVPDMESGLMGLLAPGGVRKKEKVMIILSPEDQNKSEIPDEPDNFDEDNATEIDFEDNQLFDIDNRRES